MTRFKIFWKWEFLFQIINIRCGVINQWWWWTLVERRHRVYFLFWFLCNWLLGFCDLRCALVILFFNAFLTILRAIGFFMYGLAPIAYQQRFLFVAIRCHRRIATSGWWYITLQFISITALLSGNLRLISLLLHLLFFQEHLVVIQLSLPNSLRGRHKAFAFLFRPVGINRNLSRFCSLLLLIGLNSPFPILLRFILKVVHVCVFVTVNFYAFTDIIPRNMHLTTFMFTRSPITLTTQWMNTNIVFDSPEWMPKITIRLLTMV